MRAALLRTNAEPIADVARALSDPARVQIYGLTPLGRRAIVAILSWGAR